MTKNPSAESAELIAHEWAPNNECTNPESVVIDLAKDRKATILLGCIVHAGAAAATWFFGYYAEAKSGDAVKQCKCGEPGWPSRFMALAAAIEEVREKLEEHKDKAALKALDAFVKSLGESPVAAIVERSAPNPVAALGQLPKGRFAELPISSISANPDNPRKHFDAIAGRELADSIQAQGLLQPIAVRRMLAEELGENAAISAAVPPERYEIILGERRWRAAQLPPREENGLIAKDGAILPVIECKVYEGVTRAQARAAALVENLQREKMNPIEEAEGFRDLINSTTPPLTQEQAAEMVGKSRPVVANALRVLELPEVVVAAIREGKLTLAHGVALARFKAFPKAVAVIADWAVVQGAKASQLEKGVPAAGDLLRAELAVRIQNWDFDGELPADLKKGPAIFKDGDYSAFCFDVGLYKSVKAEYDAEKKAQKEADAEKERKRMAALQKNPKKIKNLQDLPRGSYAQLTTEDKSVLALVPEATQLELKDGSEEANDVTVCTKPDLFRQIEKAVGDLKRADRKEKWTPIIVATLNAINRTKKLGQREMMLLVYAASGSNDYGAGPGLSPKSAANLGVKIPKKAMHAHVEGKMTFSVESLGLLSEETGPVDLYRVLMDTWVRAMEDDLIDQQYDESPDGELGTAAKWLLGRTELGFLEETKAGQKTLNEAVKAQEWYQRAIAELEGREFVPTAPEAKQAKGKAA